MSIHIGAKRGDIAETILLPGDPLRAKYIMETYLENVRCYNEVRGMFGYTGTYRGKPISVQGTGMGIPSISIYAEELISDFGCKTLIRVGTSGTIQEWVHLNDIILAIGASTDSNINNLTFGGMSFAPTASFRLLKKAYDYAAENGIPVRVGNVMSSDTFYNPRDKFYEIWRIHGVLAFEMETAALYTIAARHGVDALTLLTVSDSILTHEILTSEEREKGLSRMVDIALNIV